MLGAIAGDIIGSLHEFAGTKTTDFPLFTLKSFFTDDTVLPIAAAEKLLHGGDYAALYRKWGNKYPDRGYGGNFAKWLGKPGAGPYNSFGNGSAMRVSPVGFAFNSLIRTLAEAEASAAVTHNHPEGIKGAQATAAAIFLARTGKSRAEIAAYITKNFGYNLKPLSREALRDYQFDVTCQGSVPQALACALNSISYENAVRRAIALGGDADTQACIAGGVAQALYGGVPSKIAGRARAFLTPEILGVLDAFGHKFMGWPAPEVKKVDKPVKKAAEPAPEKSTKPAPVKRARPATAAKRGRVIVVDDDARYLNLLGNYLQAYCNVEVFRTTDSVEAFTEALARPPLAFITDIVHEGINGIELLKRLKKNPITRKTKVWIISGNLEIPELSALAEKHGADLMLCKPFRFDRLLNELEDITGRNKRT